MKWIFAFALLIMAPLTFAQDATPPAPQASTAGAVAPTAAQAPSVSSTVPVSQNSAPPAWVQELLETIAGLPIVGPYVSKALVYLEALGACLTALVVFLLTLSTALKGVVNFAGLTDLVVLLQNFQQSKIMYWLTSFSNIPVNSTPAKAAAPPPKVQT